MNVLSLFDGMSCGQIALNKVGVPYDNYYASEIKEHAIECTLNNYPGTIHVGDVTKIDFSSLPKIDLLIGGSPCQSFSSIGKGEGFDGESGLFYEFVRALNETKPKYFLLENVKMKKEWQDEITKHLGVKPFLMDSRWFGAQMRQRLFWTNIPFSKDIIKEPKTVHDIVEDEKSVDEKYWLKARNTYFMWNRVDFSDAPKLAAIDVYNRKVRKDGLVPTLRLPHHNSLRLWQDKRIRKFTPEESERLQNVPVGYTKGLPDSKRDELLGDGWDVKVVSHIFEGLKY